MSDLISRNAAIEAIVAWTVEDRPDIEMPTDLIDRIKALPSVQTEPSQVARDIATIIENEQDMRVIERNAQQWIPCSERLPEDYEDVLVWFEYFRYGNYNCLYQMHGIGSYSSKYDSWLINQETGWNELKVFAWMPLPKPPKEEDE